MSASIKQQWLLDEVRQRVLAEQRMFILDEDSPLRLTIAHATGHCHALAWVVEVIDRVATGERTRAGHHCLDHYREEDRAAGAVLLPAKPCGEEGSAM